MKKPIALISSGSAQLKSNADASKAVCFTSSSSDAKKCFVQTESNSSSSKSSGNTK